MSTPETFHYFPLLPPEIRLQIWRDALLAPAVWFATLPELRNVQNERSDIRMARERRALTLKPVGPAPYMAGFACRESRYEMERLITQPLRIREDSRVFWIYWNNTVLHLGQFDNARRVIWALKFNENPRLRHIAIEGAAGSWGAPCQRYSEALAFCCYGLRTIILHKRAIDSLQAVGARTLVPQRNGSTDRVIEAQLTPSAHTATLYETRSITDLTLPEISEAQATKNRDDERLVNNWARTAFLNGFRFHGWAFLNIT
ncbi:hypothetical protein B0T11DRAFT_77580 [Plectosphaerella cucumerina]|uniref:2EXR domain-containing protein n=1 Tax=Plectosphaerella cucumerina TaxID=40658 RepID=A0A8K0TBS0_9PEZI|nr:hypothetical protein B0T11DRAFT_77580 [Plectosphaerella cucumerina]